MFRAQSVSVAGVPSVDDEVSSPASIGSARLQEQARVRMSGEHPRWWYKKITRLLRDKGYRINKKQVQRCGVRRGCRCRRRSRASEGRAIDRTAPESAVPQSCVCWDFMSDYTQRGGKLRVFNLIDEYTR